MNDKFEDRLWDALKHEAERPGHELPADRFRARPVRRAVTARRAGLGLAAAAAVGTVLAVVPGGGSAPAYAVEIQKGGAVRITANEAGTAINDPAQVEALESKLREAGINVIENASTPYSCHSNYNPRTQFTQTPGRPGRLGAVMYRSDSARVHVSVLHPGDTAWIESGPADKRGRIYSIELLPATCKPVHGGH